MSAPAGYDYVVIGGGSAGCIVAAELAGHARVLLLEGGPIDGGVCMYLNRPGCRLPRCDCQQAIAPALLGIALLVI